MIMGVSMMALGSLFQYDNSRRLRPVAICCYLAGLGMSFGPIVWIMMTEIFPAPIRGQAMSMAVAAQWVANLLVSFTFPLLFGNDTLNGAGHDGFAVLDLRQLRIVGGVHRAALTCRETKGVDSDHAGAPCGAAQSDGFRGVPSNGD